jgi:hypothetical protein
MSCTEGVAGTGRGGAVLVTVTGCVGKENFEKSVMGTSVDLFASGDVM